MRPPCGDAGEVSERGPQAGWTKKNGRSRFGCKACPALDAGAHAAVDEGGGLVREAAMTPADVHGLPSGPRKRDRGDSVPADGLVRGDEEAVYADKA